nr:unnamed protein product [Callosobruchus chinensis]
MPQSAQISCYCCKKSGEDNKFVTCWLCKHVFYYTCVELSLSDIKAIKNKSNINFTCETCKETAITLADLKALVISLQEEVKELKANKHTIADQLSSSMDYEEIIQEIQDRNSRKRNLIIYGLPEDNEQPVAQRRTLDKENIKKIVGAVAEQVNCANVNPIRLGKNVQNDNPRPIKISLDNENDSTNKIQNKTDPVQGKSIRIPFIARYLSEKA